MDRRGATARQWRSEKGSRKRRQFSEEFKARVAQAAAREERTSAELATALKVHPRQSGGGKKELPERAVELFRMARPELDPAQLAAVTAPLYEQIGRLKVEGDWLKEEQRGDGVAPRWARSAPGHPELSLARQCALLGVRRSGYGAPAGQPAPRESPANLAVLREIDARYTAQPFFGSRQLPAVLRRAGYAVNRKRVQRLMRVPGVQGVRPGPATSEPAPGHRIYPYLLRDLTVVRPRRVWCSDITYLPLRQGFMSLTVVLDWYRRPVLSWALANTLDHAFCLPALVAARQAFAPGAAPGAGQSASTAS